MDTNDRYVIQLLLSHRTVYLCKIKGSIVEIHELTLEECKKQYPSLRIDESSLGYDNGTNFTTLAVRTNVRGGCDAVEYLPRPGTGCKNSIDFFIVIKDCNV